VESAIKSCCRGTMCWRQIPLPPQSRAGGVVFAYMACDAPATNCSRHTSCNQCCSVFRPSIAFFSPSGVAPLFLLLACDGVFDTMENSIVGSIAHKVSNALVLPALACPVTQHCNKLNLEHSTSRQLWIPSICMRSSFKLQHQKLSQIEQVQQEDQGQHQQRRRTGYYSSFCCIIHCCSFYPCCCRHRSIATPHPSPSLLLPSRTYRRRAWR
jgi:hypothetical protein